MTSLGLSVYVVGGLVGWEGFEGFGFYMCVCRNVSGFKVLRDVGILWGCHIIPISV